MRRETKFKKMFKKKLKRLYPECIIVEADPTYFWSVPDVYFFLGSFWAALEFKRTEGSSRRPNQEYWVEVLDKMSFARFVYPGVEEEVLSELEAAIQNR